MSDLHINTAAEEAKAIIVDKQYYAELAINSPKDLASAIAEYTRNVLGTKVSTVDHGNKSTVIFKGSAFVNKLAAVQDFGPDSIETIVKDYKNSLADAGGYFGYVTKVSSVQPDFIVSFRKTF